MISSSSINSNRNSTWNDLKISNLYQLVKPVSDQTCFDIVCHATGFWEQFRNITKATKNSTQSIQNHDEAKA